MMGQMLQDTCGVIEGCPTRQNRETRPKFRCFEYARNDFLIHETLKKISEYCAHPDKNPAQETESLAHFGPVANRVCRSPNGHNDEVIRRCPSIS